jgi:hypothetical protein
VATGQNVIAPATVPAVTGVCDKACRVFAVGGYFIIVMPVNMTGSYQLQAFAIGINSLAIRPTFTVSTSYAPGLSIAVDGAVTGGFLYLGWNGASTSGIRMTDCDSNLVFRAVENPDPAHLADYLSVCIDESGSAPIVWVVYNDNAATSGYTFAVSSTLASQLAPTQWSSVDVLNVTATAQDNSCEIVYELDAPYSYNSTPNHIISGRSVTLAGSVGAITVRARGVGIASKAFLYNDTAYLLAAYESDYQPSYFLIQSNGAILAKLAYSNGTGYVDSLPQPAVVGSEVFIGYELKTRIQAVNKEQGVANTAGVYAQTGLNLASFNFTSENLTVAEIGNVLNISGGFLWSYDGYEAVEQGFFLWPDNLKVTTATSGGLITAQQYYYQAVYEWQDNQGNLYRSAPSLPMGIVTTGAVSTNTIDVPTLRLTYKTANPVKIVLYRWSAAQQNYYQVTSITSPTLNNPSVDSVAITDILADSAILGNSLIYTTGGVVENIQAPACEGLALFDSRLWLINSEDKSQLWFSKQVIPATPVETSDLLTYNVTPVVGANNPAGPNRVLYPMDDKLIVSRDNSMVYINGEGPDNLGLNSQYSQPIFITATVGSANPSSFVLAPNGLLFESNKGIWLLGRNLSTQYIGAPVEGITEAATVLSAISVPATNQLRFTMSDGQVVMYDYYYDQWGTFEGIPAISSTIYEGRHTYINRFGQVAQEREGVYLDNSNPVLMKFTTGWFNLMGLQGYQRFYQMYMLGEFYTPFKLNVQFGFDYNPPTQSVQVLPDNYSPAWGGDPSWGASSPWGGPTNTFEARVFPTLQKCESFQVIVDEVYDNSYGVLAGAGFTLSGLNLVVGAKKKYRTSTAARSFG